MTIWDCLSPLWDGGFHSFPPYFWRAAILTGLCCRLGEENIVSSFVSGAAELLGVAFIIGISRGITVIMNNGKITDTILSWGEDAWLEQALWLFWP